MELRQLNSFITITKLQSFSKAAVELGYAQSSITSQIQLLEQELNVKLFERLGHNITLTPEGKQLLPMAEQMLKLSKDVKNISVSSDMPSGPLIIGAVESLCVTRLPKLLKEYRSRYPNVEIFIKFGARTEFLRSLKENTIDIAFFVDQKITNNDFVTVLQTPEPMALLCSPEHAFACRENVYPEDLSGEPLILTESSCGYRALFDTIMSQFSIKPRSVIETGNVQAIKQLVLSGMGITFLPQTAVEEELQQKRLVKLNWIGPEFLIFTQVLCHKTKWMSAALKAFIELMNEMNL
ncbi:MAG TPA: LysR family transcriptional regulator [Clostridia bacterium]|nr:LysR family transcriptional regulator [Clostridia bacterium]